MKNFTGLHKKSIAGSRCGIFLLLLLTSCFTWAAEPAATSVSDPATNQIAAENNVSQAVSPPINATNTSVATTSPVTSLKPASTKTNSASQLASVVGGLAIILVLIYGLSWFVKRFAQGGFAQNASMKIISSMPLGTRERLMLVEVGGKQLLLGVTATQINTLHLFNEPVIAAEKSQPAASDFSQKLMAIIQKNNSPDMNAPKNSNR